MLRVEERATKKASIADSLFLVAVRG